MRYVYVIEYLENGFSFVVAATESFDDAKKFIDRKRSEYSDGYLSIRCIEIV